MKQEKEIIRLLEEEKGKEMKQQWETLITQDIHSRRGKEKIPGGERKRKYNKALEANEKYKKKQNRTESTMKTTEQEITSKKTSIERTWKKVEEKRKKKKEEEEKNKGKRAVKKREERSIKERSRGNQEEREEMVVAKKLKEE
jgi:hypothetical protein